MANINLNTAFKNMLPVEYHGVKYRHITAVIYRAVSKGQHIVQVELLDKCGHSVVIASPQEVYVLNERIKTED